MAHIVKRKSSAVDFPVEGKCLEYTGTRRPALGEQDKNSDPIYPYIPDRRLVEAVNVAIFLNRPLFIRGEPGSGKTRLAQAVAYDLELPIERWHVKSTSQARDGLYSYDTVGRLRDAQLAVTADRSNKKPDRYSVDPNKYVRFGPLGRAFLNEQRTVLLIDEIDKADIDFPNDLLLELDERYFTVEETGKVHRARHSPIIIITSNDERSMSDAFLRRCIFHFIPFPSQDSLEEILQARFPQVRLGLCKKAVHRFIDLRKKMDNHLGGQKKRVSTSELIDWVEVLSHQDEEKALGMLDDSLPFPGVLLKSWEDHLTFFGQDGRVP